MTELGPWLVLVLLYLFVGRLLYRNRWPDGFMPDPDDDGEIDRVRRVGRRRIQPLPHQERRGAQ